MRDRYHVYAMEQRGQCDSEWTKEYTWQKVVQDIDAFIDALHLAPVTIVVHSSGAVCSPALALLWGISSSSCCFLSLASLGARPTPVTCTHHALSCELSEKYGFGDRN